MSEKDFKTCLKKALRHVCKVIKTCLLINILPLLMFPLSVAKVSSRAISFPSNLLLGPIL
jgi:hypothetical protein